MRNEILLAIVVVTYLAMAQLLGHMSSYIFESAFYSALYSHSFIILAVSQDQKDQIEVNPSDLVSRLSRTRILSSQKYPSPSTRQCLKRDKYQFKRFSHGLGLI